MSQENNIHSLHNSRRYRDPGSAVLEKKLLGAFSELSYEHLQSVMQGMFDNADDTLFKLLEKSEQIDDQSLYFDSMRLVRLQKENIQLTFFGIIKEAFIDFKNHTSEVMQDSDESSFVEMEIMDEDQLEEMLALSSISNKLNAHFSAELNAIQKRFSTLYTSDESVTADSIPFSPKIICSAFNEAFKSLDIELEIRLILFKLFDQHIIKGLARLYKVINDRFIDEGVLPKIKHEIKNNAEATTYHPEKTEYATFEQPPVTTGLLGELQNLLSAGKASSPLPTTGHMPAAASTQQSGHQVSVMAHESLVSSINNEELARLAMTQNPGSFQTGENVKQYILSQMSKENADGTAVINQVDNDLIDIVSMLFEFILDDELIVPSVRASLARLQIPMIKVALLDKQFINSKSHPARRLLNELAKAGLGIEEQNDSDDELIVKINSIVEDVITGFETDMSLFDNLLNELSEFQVDRENRALSAAQQEVKQKEDIALAQAWVREVLSEHLLGKRLPGAVADIIQGPWKEVMLNTYLQEGEDSRNWKNQLRFIDVLTWSVEPKQNGMDRNRLGNIISYLVNTLREGLVSLDYSQQSIHDIFEKIEPYHHASLHGYDEHSSHNTSGSFFLYPQDQEPPQEMEKREIESSSQKPISDIDSAIMQMEHDFKQLSDPFETDIITDTDDSESSSAEDNLVVMENIVLQGWEREEQGEFIDDEYLQIARHLELGKWVEFTGETGKKTRAKLGWKSELLGECVFLDWKYSAVADKTIQGLATDLRRGQCRILDEGPLLDRAFSYMIHRLTPGSKSQDD